MRNKYYSVVYNEKENGDHSIDRYSNKTDAIDAAKKKRGKVYEYDQPLGVGDDQRKGRLIGDYSN